MIGKSVIIVGSGAAGYAAADRLLSFGIKDIALVTENKNFGTSRNTGSDKQTYYKADLSVSHSGILDMAEAIYGGGAIDGDRAIVEAANSIRCFYTLVDLGVDFPQGDFGEYIGYKTDHDDSQRATSIGPLTSKAMTEALERSALARGLELIDNSIAIKLVVVAGKVRGLIVYDKVTSDFRLIAADAVILATGGSACVYKQTVYPPSQHGATSLALEAGAKVSSINEWQYGIASTKFRWNLSGSYQQVIPRYISIDEEGVEREFLSDYIDGDKVYELEFLKGYEWPFDTRKIAGSSKVDIAVLEEIKKGRRVYLDYMHDPKGLNIESIKVAYEYLDKAGAAKASTPYERLAILNPRAIELYREHKIDIETEYLEIAVSAQHCNGGVSIDSYYRSDIDGLFVIGEASGNFGIYRPGGTALNSTQVGALRSAVYLRDNLVHEDIDLDEDALLGEVRDFAREHLGEDNVVKVTHDVQKKMSESAGIVRDVDALLDIKKELEAYLDGSQKVTVGKPERYGELFRTYDMLRTDYVLVKTILEMADKQGSHGGAMVVKDGKMIPNTNICMDNIVETDYHSVTMRARRPIETKTYSFEKVMNKNRD